VAALSGVGTTVLLYFLGKEIRDKRAGLWACFLFTIYPLAIVYTRWAFPYALGMFWITLTIYFCFKYLNSKSGKYLYLAGIATAVAVFTIYYAFELALFLLAFMLLNKVDWKKIVTIMSIVVIPFVLFIGVMMLIDARSVLFDLGSLLWRSSQEIVPKHNFWSILAGYKKLWLLDAVMFCGIFGLFFTKREYRPYLWLGFFCISLLPIARQGLFLDIFFYPLVICLPFIFLGLASFIIFILDKSKLGIERGFSKLPPLSKVTQSFIHLVPIIIILIILTPMVIKVLRSVNTIFVAKMNYFANRNINDTRTVAEYLNQNTKPDDLVIAPPSVYQFLNCHYAS
ncbi:MAG: glycosyltransferase family 39 protein, partial [bacterium]|nr:glycosyltransferase family 39 protein [bacterium]